MKSGTVDPYINQMLGLVLVDFGRDLRSTDSLLIKVIRNSYALYQMALFPVTFSDP